MGQPARSKVDLGFALFLLVNAVLFLRPSEIVPSLEDMPIYEVVILLCLAVSLSRVLRQLSIRAVLDQPITACILGMLVFGILSHLVHREVMGAYESARNFTKVLLYYLLAVSVIDSLPRLRQFLLFLVGLFVVLTVLALLQYYGAINVPALQSYAERQWELEASEGSPIVLLRLCGPGLFANPNDLSRILVIGIIIALYGLRERGRGGARVLWVVLLGLFAHALMLTYSRGGFLALLSGLGAPIFCRLGAWRTAALACILLPPLLLVEGRQTKLSVGEGTGQDRVKIWSDRFVELREQPVLGIGMNRYPEDQAQIAEHNSFLSCYVQMGFLGGSCFLGAWYCAMWFPYNVGREQLSREPTPAGAQLARFRPYLLAIIISYIAGMISSSRSYTPPTYLLLALAVAYVRVACESLRCPKPRLNVNLVARIALVSLLSLAGLYLFVRLTANYG
jgi:hypothetical protein